jgi:hypothetical protein
MLFQLHALFPVSSLVERTVYIYIHHHSLMTEAQDAKHWTLNLNQTDMDGCQENFFTFGGCESFKVYTNHKYL